jgi:hypothetical protein
MNRLNRSEFALCHAEQSEASAFRVQFLGPKKEKPKQILRRGAPQNDRREWICLRMTSVARSERTPKKFAQRAKILNRSNTKDTKGSDFSIVYFPILRALRVLRGEQFFTANAEQRYFFHHLPGGTMP